jgi:tetratricopeptide (TPR) repeat protein
MKAAPRNDVQFFNLGLIYRRNGLIERALEAFERAAAINPRHIPSANPVRPADKAAELREEVEQRRALERTLAADLDLDTAHGLREMLLRLQSRSSTEERLWARGYGLRAEEIEAQVSLSLHR